MQATLNIIISIVRTPAILVALIAALGLSLQKKSMSDIIGGGIKTFLGFLVLTGGADLVSDSLEPLGNMFIHTFDVQGVVPNNEAVVGTLLVEFGTVAALIMLISMIVNALLARFTYFKYIYLSGHVMLYMAAMLAVILDVIGFSNVMAILIGGLILGMANTIMPALVQPFMREVTKSDTVALAHTGDFGYAVSGVIAKFFGNKSKSTEELNIPKSVSFLRDTNIAITLTMSVIYVIMVLFAGPSYINEMSGGLNYIVFAFVQAGTFAAGVYIILAGVRLILNQIIPAFKGISQSLVPNSVPALDAPVVFPYAPNAVIVGFFSSFVGGIISMLAMVILNTTIVIPGVVAHFMCGAASDVIGNQVGGRRGAVLGAFIQGIAISFIPLALVPMMGEAGLGNATFSDSDFGVVGSLVGYIGNVGGQAAVIITVLVALVLLFLASHLVKNHSQKVSE